MAKPVIAIIARQYIPSMVATEKQRFSKERLALTFALIRHLRLR
jgi:hypothetical protein